MSWDDYFAGFLKKDNAELLDSAEENYEIYQRYVHSQFDDEDEAKKFIWRTIFMVITADGELTEGEFYFYKAFWKRTASSDALFDDLKDINVDFYMDQIQKLPTSPKTALLNIATCVACCDGWLMGDEKTFLKDMWNGI